MILVTVYHDACIENLLLRLILFTFRLKLKAPLRQMSDFTLSPPILAAILCNAPPSSFSVPPPDNSCTVPKCDVSLLPHGAAQARFQFAQRIE